MYLSHYKKLIVKFNSILTKNQSIRHPDAMKDDVLEGRDDLQEMHHGQTAHSPESS